MRLLPRDLCWSAADDAPPRFDLRPLQLGLGRNAWRVAVASQLLCRTRRVQAEPALEELLERWPTPERVRALASAAELESVLRPLGLQRSRARRLLEFSSLYATDRWSFLQELPGVGPYVADAVGLVCFGYEDVSSGDRALLDYLEALA